ncbi:hypothetical protein GDO78_021607 [Eleutherodactylus coqui]|uniref:Uncharacterized protein n=1 Tax=Eleutherodactylus coqui TaxID=57060 RepID=A0A8J6BIS1_ELECQ|nr:hypothetical protein GDO78_021607 [Eleutherodactylus coqui]
MQFWMRDLPGIFIRPAAAEHPPTQDPYQTCGCRACTYQGSLSDLRLQSIHLPGILIRPAAAEHPPTRDPYQTCGCRASTYPGSSALLTILSPIPHFFFSFFTVLSPKQALYPTLNLVAPCRFQRDALYVPSLKL